METDKRPPTHRSSRAPAVVLRVRNASFERVAERIAHGLELDAVQDVLEERPRRARPAVAGRRGVAARECRETFIAVARTGKQSPRFRERPER